MYENTRSSLENWQRLTTFVEHMVLMNLQQVKGVLDEDTGELVDAESISKSNKALESINIATMEMRNGILELRDPMVILDELANKWENLTSVQQSQITEALAGKYRSNQFVALISQWDMYNKMLQDQTDATGSAMQEVEVYMNSFEGKMNIFNNTLSDFVNRTINSEFMKGMVDGGTTALNILGDLDNTLKLVLGSIILIKRENVATNITKLAESLGGSKGLNFLLNGTEDALDGITKASKGSLFSLSNLVGVVGLAITAFGLISMVVDNYNRQQEELKQKALETAQASNAEQQEIGNLVNSYKELANKTELTTSEKSNLISIQDTLTNKLGLEKNAIDLLNGSYERNIALIDAARRAKAAEKAEDIRTEFEKSQDYLTGTSSILTTSGTQNMTPTQYKMYLKNLIDSKKGQYSEGNMPSSESTLLQTWEKRYRELETEINTNFEIVQSYNKLKSGIQDIVPTAIDSSVASDAVPYYVGDSSKSSKTGLSYNDPTQAIIDQINQESILNQKKNESLATQIKAAEEAKDYAKQIELQNQLLENQKITAESLIEANSKIHAEAQKIRAATSYNTESWFNADGSDTVEYINLLNKFAGRTDDASKKAVDGIKAIHDKLKLLKDAWRENADAIVDMSLASKTATKEIQDNLRSYTQSVSDAESEIVKLYEWQLDKKLDKLKEQYDKEKELAEASYNEKKQQYQDELEDYRKYIQDRLDALNKSYDEDRFNEDLAEKQKELAEIQAKINELSLSAGSGDRVAIAKQKELNDELAKKQQEIDRFVADRSKQIQEDALKNVLSKYEDHIQNKQEVLDSDYAREVAQIDELYRRKEEKLKDSYSKEELYSKARKALMSGEYDEITSMYEKFQKEQGDGWSALGGVLEDEFLSKLREAQDILFALGEEGISTKRLIEAIGGSGSGSSSSGSNSGKSRVDIGFGELTDEEWRKYKSNKQVYEDSSSSKADKEAAAAVNARMRAKYGIASDRYSYNDIKNVYDTGGSLASGNYALNLSGQKEQVLSPTQTKAFDIWMTKVPDLLFGLSNLKSLNIPNNMNNRSSVVIEGNLVNIEGNADNGTVRQLENNATNIMNEISKMISSGNPRLSKGIVL